MLVSCQPYTCTDLCDVHTEQAPQDIWASMHAVEEFPWNPLRPPKGWLEGTQVPHYHHDLQPETTYYPKFTQEKQSDLCYPSRLWQVQHSCSPYSRPNSLQEKPLLPAHLLTDSGTKCKPGLQNPARSVASTSVGPKRSYYHAHLTGYTQGSKSPHDPSRPSWDARQVSLTSDAICLGTQCGV